MKKLDEHNKERREQYAELREAFGRLHGNGIECPECGRELVDSAPAVVLTSMPPMKKVSCNACGYTGYRIA